MVRLVRKPVAQIIDLDRDETLDMIRVVLHHSLVAVELESVPEQRILAFVVLRVVIVRPG